MTLNLTTKNYALPPEMRNYLEERISKVTSRLDAINTDVYIKRNTHHKQGDIFDVEVIINVPKKMIVAKTQAPDVRAALHILEKKLDKQIARYRRKATNEKNYSD